MKDWMDEKTLKAMTKKDAAREVSNAVYEACSLYERLEGIGRVRGNGHHMAQKIAKVAEELMIERWEDPKPNNDTDHGRGNRVP